MSEALVIAALNRLEGGQTALQAVLGSVQGDVVSLKDGVASLTDDVASLKDDMASMKVEVSTLRGEMESLQRSHVALRDSQISLRVELMARMARLENRLTEIRDDISVNMASNRHTHEAIENTRDELRSLVEQVNIMWRQMKRLEQQVRDITGDS